MYSGLRVSLFFFLFIIIVVLSWLVDSPLLLHLDSEIEGSVVVSGSVVTNACVPPESVEAEGGAQHVGVVELVVVANP